MARRSQAAAPALDLLDVAPGAKPEGHIDDPKVMKAERTA
jgi:hypothetical protein